MNHWYDHTGRACHTIVGKNGIPRDTTLADARREGWLPSVTTIIKQTLAAPELERWKITQAIHAALTLPELPGESLDARVERIRRDSEEHAKQAAIRGSEVHDSLCRYLHGQSYPERDGAFIRSLERLIESRFGMLGAGPVKTIWSEKTLVGNGYAGTPDWLVSVGDEKLLLDFKGQDFRDGKPRDRQAYWIQLAAYAEIVNPDLVGVVYFDRQTGAMECALRSIDEIRAERVIWWNLHEIWCLTKKYDPAGVRAA